MSKAVRSSISARSRFLIVGCARLLRSCAKSAARLLIGRGAAFTPQDTFFRLYLKQLLGLGPIRMLTCVGFRREGAGSQALMMMHAIGVAQACGLTYLHTPFATIAHRDRPTEEWVAGWESMFNLGAGEPRVSPGDRAVIDFAPNSTDLARCFGVDPHDAFVRAVPQFRRKYYLNKHPRANDVVIVGVHMRRGDVSARRSDMWTDTVSVVRTIAKVTSILAARNRTCTVRVFSQGSEEEFAAFKTLAADVILNADAMGTLRELIEADVLVMAKSCFSYVAGVICDGIKLYEPCVYPPLDDWLVRDSTGEFDGAEFERQLLRRW